MCTSHDIILTNLKNDEIIIHEILLIKGYVTSPCSETKIILKENNDTEKKYDISNDKKGIFKIICQLLSDGLNQFELSYCNKSIKFSCVYERASSIYKVQPLYIVCKNHDGSFNSDTSDNNSKEACRKIDLGLKVVQCLYSEKLSEQSLGRKTFTINNGCLIFNSSLEVEEARRLDETSLWNEFAKEIINSQLGEDETLKFIAFIGCTKYETISNGDFSYTNIKSHTKAHANLGGGGLALFGSGCLYSWPSEFDDIIDSFKNPRKIDLCNFLDDSNYRRTYGGCYSTTVGAVCHEMGHIFDLGHTIDGIMGNGFDYINLVFTINNFTESLPSRIVQKYHSSSTGTGTSSLRKDTRLTKLRQPGGEFLQKHHEQKIGGDSTYFTPSCAAILSYHKWFNNYKNEAETEIQFNVENSIITTVGSNIKVIEIRENVNSLVIKYFDLSKEESTIFKLTDNINLKTHNLFVITSDGSARIFS